MKKAFKYIWHWIDDRTGISETVLPLLNHPVPPRSLWSYVFGSATLFVFVLQVITGVALSLLYQPSSDSAYQSLQFITDQAKFGNVLRGIHYYGASAMIILVGLHMMRTYITASYKFPREMNWISGVFLLLFTIFMGFTGQLLRWDSNGVWSSVVAAQQLGRIPLLGKYVARLLLGGDTIGGQSLSRFYSYHVFIIPALIFLFIALHIYLVFRNGISEPPKAGRPVDPSTYRAWYKQYLIDKSIPFWPNAAWRDVLFSSLIVILIIVLAILFGAPALTTPPDPSMVQTSPNPDWYMVPFFALFALMPHKIESIAMMIGPVLTVIILLSIPFLSNKGERSPLKRPWAMFGVLCVFVFVITLLVIGLQAPWSPDFKATPLPISAVRHSSGQSGQSTQSSQPNQSGRLSASPSGTLSASPGSASSASPAGSAFADSSLIRGVHLFYAKGCEYCHRINGYGGRAGPELTIVGNRLSTQQLTLRIVNGGGNMPAFGGILSKEELSDLVSFLSLQK